MATTLTTSIAPEFIGRSNELSFLLDCVTRADAGSGAVACISGDAGMGKSRLIHELRAALDSDRLLFGVGTCLEYMQVPYLPLLEAFHELAGSHGDRRRSTGPLQRWLDDVESSQTVEIAMPVDDQKKYQRFAAARKAVAATVKHATAVLAIEDIQWADAATLEFLDFLARDVSGVRLLLIVSYRREAEATGAKLASTLARLRRAGSFAIALAPLTAGETRELVFRMLRRNTNVDPLLVDRIYELSEGNPLYIEELVRAICEGGFPRSVTAGVVPLTIKAAIQERLNQVAPDEQDILTLAAVMGLRFSADRIAQLANTPDSVVLAVLHKARRTQLVEAEDDGQSFRFRHAMIREALYEQRPPAEKQRLHAEIAKQCEALPEGAHRTAELAYHWSAAGDADRAVVWNELAGDAAIRVFAYSDAARFYKIAVGLLAKSGLPRAKVLEKLAYALSVGGFGEHARIWFERALDEYRELGATEKMIGMLLNISAQCWVNAETDPALHMCARALEIASFVPNSPLQFNARVMLATYCALRGRAHEAIENLDKAERINCERDPGYDSRFLDVRGIALDILGDTAAAQQSFERSHEIAAGIGDRDLMTRVCSNYADFAISIGDLELAAKCWQSALSQATQSEYVWHSAFLALSFAWTQFLAGDFEEARRLCEFGISRGEESTLVRILAVTVGIPLGLILNDEALLKRCSDEEAIEFAFRSGEAQHIGGVVAAFSQLFAQRGETEKAKALLHRGLTAIPNADQAEIMLCEVAKLGDAEDVEQARRTLEQWAQPAQHVTAQAFLFLFNAQDALGKGELGAARSNALRAAGLLERIGILYYRAVALELGSCLGEALECYEALKVRRDIERVRGARAGMRARHAKIRLTSRELEIARLVAQGMTNRSIAAALSISKRTVDHHVNAILAHAALRSRVQLAMYLTENGLLKETHKR